MAGPFTNIIDPLIANTFYADSQLCAKNVEIVLPGLTRKTVSIDAYGVELPMQGQFEASNMQVHVMGVNSELAHACAAGKHTYEVRFVQQKIDFSGNSKPVGGYCYVEGVSKGLPEMTISPGNSTDNTVEIIPYTFRIVVDGETVAEFDRFNGVATLWGVDEASDVEQYL